MSYYKALFASDIHFPRHEPRHVDLLLQVMKKWKPDSVDLLGDIDDADTTSRWAVGADLTIPIQDAGVSQTKYFLKEVRDLLPDADCHLHDGNHGYTRHKLALDKNVPTFSSYITADMLYGYKDSGFEWHYYSDPPVKRHGSLYCHHGESISKHAGESVRNDCLSWGVSVIRGHSHRQGVYNISYPLDDRTLSGYEIGHLTNVSAMDYDRSPNWQSGFAIAHVENDIPYVQLVEIKENICFVDGIKFQA